MKRTPSQIANIINGSQFYYMNGSFRYMNNMFEG